MTYPGGKNGSGIYQRLINLMPPHQVYVEPFLGGGALMRLKRPAAINIGVDLNGDLIGRWLASIAGNGAPAAPWILPPETPETPVPADLGGNGVGRSRTAENGDRRRRASPALPVPDPVATTVRSGVVAGGIARNAGAISRFDFRQGDGIAFLETCGGSFSGREMLIYCDPPYLLSARTSCDEDYYRCEMTDVQHRKLLRILRRLKCRVMLSGYSSHLYDKHLEGWNSIRYMAPTRRGFREEWLWFNFPAPVELHDYRYLGEDYRERENLKRQQRRWKAKLMAMPLPQRQALLAAIADTA